MHWIHISPHKLLHPQHYLPSDLPSHSRGRRLGLLTVLQTPSFSIPTVWIHCKCEAEGIPTFQRAPATLRNQNMASMTLSSTGTSDFLPLFLKSFSSYFWGTDLICMLQSPKIHGFHHKNIDMWYASNSFLIKWNNLIVRYPTSFSFPSYCLLMRSNTKLMGVRSFLKV